MFSKKKTKALEREKIITQTLQEIIKNVIRIVERNTQFKIDPCDPFSLIGALLEWSVQTEKLKLFNTKSAETVKFLVNWTPTRENIDALSDPVRCYILAMTTQIESLNQTIEKLVTPKDIEIQLVDEDKFFEPTEMECCPPEYVCSKCFGTRLGG